MLPTAQSYGLLRNSRQTAKPVTSSRTASFNELVKKRNCRNNRVSRKHSFKVDQRTRRAERFPMGFVFVKNTLIISRHIGRALKSECFMRLGLENERKLLSVLMRVYNQRKIVSVASGRSGFSKILCDLSIRKAKEYMVQKSKLLH
ncbi:uncharacterized protein PHALS_14893 [Plasmopara halstedii]|uniref:Uncharacterized protein n=1 Tax=Plasmopara halstedii TaxID=4781 RepID=A0A0N7L777_PLAHL|nr:uncharacterized protein PHALS_14893 [Plasmopara halstedii]CEG46307.1 hypothetical protein PHALS_14893 [Plasmopara halstedii]|eukprot:XP_024582676.1 hypothetical protein PHALS_14893 [Plasmopara halstedii]